MDKLFLTGAVQVGKTTAIRRFLETAPQLRLGGFATKLVPSAAAGAERDVYILPPLWTREDLRPERLVARRREGRWELCPRAFEEVGTALLRREGPFDLLLMDELGRMELGAPRFVAEVLSALDGDVPVLGVIKPESNPLLDAVRAHPRVRVLMVTEENREDIPRQIGELLTLG